MDNQLLPYMILVGLLLLVLIAGLASEKPKRSEPTTYPYAKEPHLLSKGERAFFFALCKALGYSYHIFPKVRLIDLVTVIPDTRNIQAHKNRIISKHVDFVLCARDTFSPLLVIELDDASHNRPDRQARDASKDAVLNAAGLPILRVPAQSTYDPQALANLISSKLPVPATSHS